MTKLLLGLCFAFVSVHAFAETSYTVQKGDTLLGIADRELGITDKKDARRYQLAQKIQKANPQIKNPDRLEPGLVLNLPDAPVSASASPRVTAPKAPSKKALKAEPSHATDDHGESAEDPEASKVEASTPVPPARTPTPATKPKAILLTPGSAPQPMPEAAPKIEDPNTHGSELAAEPQITLKPAPDSETEKAAPAKDAHAGNHDGGHAHFIGIQPRYQQLKLDVTNEATHAESRLESQSSLGLDVQFGYALGDRAHLIAQIGFTSTDFKALEGAATSINHTREEQMLYAIGAAYELTTALHVDGFLNTADRTFVIPSGIAGYSLEKVMIPGAELNLSWDFARARSTVFGVSLIGEYVAALSKDGVDYKSTLEPVGALYVATRNGGDKMNYRATLTYKNGHQHTNLSEQKEQAFILGLLILLPVGGH